MISPYDMSKWITYSTRGITDIRIREKIDDDSAVIVRSSCHGKVNIEANGFTDDAMYDAVHSMTKNF